MADAIVQLFPDSTGQKCDCDSLTVGANTVVRQRMRVAGGAAAEISDVKNASPTGSHYGMVARNIPRRESSIVTTAQLASAAVFTQAWQDTTLDGTEYVEATAFVATQASAAQGFVLQETDDTANASFTSVVDQASVPLSTLTRIGGPIRCRYYRIVYTNGTGATTTSLEITATASISENMPFEGDLDAQQATGGGGVGIFGYNGLTWDRIRAFAASASPAVASQGVFAYASLAATNAAGTAVVPVNSLAGNSDGQGAGNVGAVVVPYTLVFNGTTWDRILARNIGIDPGSAAKGALVVQGSQAGIALPVNLEGQKRTYMASFKALVPVATATDVFVITGSATTVVKVVMLVLSGIATTAITVDVQLIKRSSADTLGTSTNSTFITVDASDVTAATALFTGYTANPTLGGQASILATKKVFFPLTAVEVVPWVIDFSSLPAKCVTLRSAAQQLALHFNSVTVAGGSMDCYAIITEE